MPRAKCSRAPFVLGLLAVVVCLFTIALPATEAAAAQVDPVLLAGLEARAIGPAVMSGRTAAIAVDPRDTDVVYVGAATGGLWKSTDGALTFEPLFDDQPVASIGAVAVDPSAPDVIWVGTGEGNPRNSASVGNGVYKSIDGGATWEHLGLERSERIHRILIDPRDTDVVYVAALGPTWGEGGERGVYKTTDGGATWRLVLAGSNDTTGAADLVMDPGNPGKLVAALWDHRRWPHFFRSGGPGSGIFLSHDGGETWAQRTPEDGLPAGELGRIGLAVAPSDGARVYALVEAEETAFYRSDDGGRTFRIASTDAEIGNRPFYYADLRVDTQDPNRVYSLWSRVSVSKDGGATWDELVGWNDAHPDHHAMWIDPDDPEHLLLGNDGGVYESRNHGEGWRFVASLPFAQFYHVRVDDQVPYNVYGGLQDNGSWKGPSEVWQAGGIQGFHWQEVFFGDGFDTAAVPGDPDVGYAMSQEGYLARWNLATGERKHIRPAPLDVPPANGEGAEGPDPLRFNWNAGLALDPFDPDGLYFGSQYVHRSRDRGDSWETISPDLTTDRAEWQRQDESGGLTLDDTGAENFTSIVALAASPVEQGVVWAGTDDGRLHVTRDGGDTWESVEASVRGVPANTWIPQIHPSSHDAGEAFVVFDDHRRSNWTPYVFRTRDFGGTWDSLATEEIRGYALSILQDPVDPELLWLGTEFGLWVSFDGGGSWSAWNHGVPTVSVMDLAFQERERDLVLGTHGRGIFILDDVAPLREVSAELLAESLHLFPIPSATIHNFPRPPGGRFGGAGAFVGENPPYGALVTFSAAGDDLPFASDEAERTRKASLRETERLEEAATEAGESPAPRRDEQTESDEDAEGEEGDSDDPDEPEAEIVVTDSAGTAIRTFETPVTRGLNRVPWDLAHDGYREPAVDLGERFFEPSGPAALPGTYTVTVRFRGEERSGTVEVLPDPRLGPEATDGLRAQLDARKRMGAVQERLSDAIDRVRDARTDVDALVTRSAAADERADSRDEEPRHEDLIAAGRELSKALAELERQLWVPPDTRGIPRDDTPWGAVNEAGWRMGGSSDAPTAAQLYLIETAEAKTADALERVERFFAEEVAPFRQRVSEAGVGLLADGPRG